MSLRQALLPEAAEEPLEAAEWYESGRLGLGAEFVGAVEHAMSAAVSMPLAAAPWPGSKRFPYILICEVRVDVIEFVAIAHTSREPGYWLKRGPTRI